MSSKRIEKKRKSKQPTSSASKEVVKKLTNEEVRDSLLDLRMLFDPDIWSEKDLKEIRDMVDEEPSDEILKVVMALGFDNDYTLVCTVSERYRGLVIELRRKLIMDFDCKTHAEKALVDMAVSGYMRVIRASQAFTSCLDKGTTDSDINQFMSLMSKEMDRAHRHFTTSYQMLAQLKQPPLNVNLKTKNAYVAQAQQFNMDDRKSKESEEIISPK